MPIQVKDLANIPEEEKLEKERLELIEKANEFRKGIINTLKSNDKIENREGNDTSFYIYYNYKKKEIVTEDEMYDEIERRFSGIEQFPFYSLIIDNDRKPPYAVIHFSIYEDYLSITCEYLEKIIKDGYGTTFHGEGRGDSFFGNCRLVFKRQVDYGKYNDRIIFFKTGHIVQSKEKGFGSGGVKNKKFIPLMFNKSIDFLDTANSIILKQERFRNVRDLVRERDRIPNTDERSFSYNEIIEDETLKSGKEFVMRRWKRLEKLKPFLNVNKFTFIELLELRRLQPKLTEDEFRRVVQWYHKNRASVLESLEEEDFTFKYKYLYYFYIQDRCNVNIFFEYYRDELDTTLEDIFMMANALRYKVEIKGKSWNGFNNYHDYLVLKLNKQKARRSKKKFKLQPYWVKIDEALKQSKLKTRRLDSAEALELEGATMHHCVGIYADKVNSGKAYIFHVGYKGKSYTCELNYKASNRTKEFYIRQLYGKYNRTAPQPLHEEIQKLISE